MVSALAWWIADYDPKAGRWFEQAYPMGKPVAGILTGQGNSGLNVDLSAAPAKDGIDVMVYKISMSVAPGANTPFMLQFADNAGGMAVKSWGLAVGSWAAAAYG